VEQKQAGKAEKLNCAHLPPTDSREVGVASAGKGPNSRDL